MREEGGGCQSGWLWGEGGECRDEREAVRCSLAGQEEEDGSEKPAGMSPKQQQHNHPHSVSITATL